MAAATQQQQGLELRKERMDKLVSANIKTPAELAVRIREMQEQAFVLSPVTAITAIAPGYEITPVVVVIDPSVDPKSGRGADVYFQSSIHKSVKQDNEWTPVEVSLNHYGLLRILGAYGVNVRATRWMADGINERYLWVCETDGDIIDFDGRVRALPTGVGSLDARDGSADIGEWTPEEWKKRVAAAEAQKARTPEKDQWKCKPEPINGWTGERVMQVRKYGRQLTKTKSLNGLARKLGVRQSYNIQDLKNKPFVIMRPMFMPNMNNPAVEAMVTAVNLGARASLFPHADELQTTHAIGEAGQTFDQEQVETAASPTDAEEASFEEVKQPQPEPKGEPTFTITKVLQRKKEGAATTYFVETKEGTTFYTPERDLAAACDKAKKDGAAKVIDSERVQVDGQTYLQIIELRAANGLKV